MPIIPTMGTLRIAVTRKVSLLKMKKLLLTILLCSGLSACGTYTPFPKTQYFTKNRVGVTAHESYTFALASTEDEDILTVSFRYNLPTVTRDGKVVVDERFDGIENDDGTDDIVIQNKLNDFKFKSVYITKSIQYPDDLAYAETDFARLDLEKDAFGTSIETECKIDSVVNGTSETKNNKASCTLLFPAGTFPTVGKKFIRILGLNETDDAVEDFLVASPKLNISKANPASEEDGDSDGIADDEDNCPDLANDDQLDTDNDGIGDACEDIPNDRDNDHIVDGEDNCPELANGDQLDTDNDGTGDACEERPTDCVNKATIGGEHVENKVGACGDVDKDIMHKGKARLSDGGSCSLNPKTPHQNWELFFLLGGTLYLASKRRKA